MLSFIAWLIGAAVLTVALVGGYFVYVTRRIAATAERHVPRTGQTVEVDGDEIRYVDQGEGRPILFIHGLGAQLHQFTGPLFPELGDGFRLVALDRPGSGYSVKRRSGPRLPEQADAIARFIDRIGLERPLVVGHSLGGAIALALALRHPDKVAGLALVSPLTRHIPRPPEAYGGLFIESPFRRWLIARTVAVPMSLKTAKQVIDFTFAPQPATPDYMTRGGGYLGLRPSHFFAVSSDLVAVGEDLPAQQLRYGELTMPVSVIYGTADKVIDHAEQGVWMRDTFPAVELELLDGVGHMPQFVAADRVAAFVRQAADRAFAAQP